MYDPVMWADIDNISGHIDPSTVHTSSAMKAYFTNYLLEDLFSIFEYSGMPDHWEKWFYNYVLFVRGFVGVLNTDRYGVIPQICMPYGRGVYYQPVRAIFSNPIFEENYDLKIGANCSIIRLQPNYSSIMNLVSMYADMMALCVESAGVNLQNTKLAYLFIAKNKLQAETWKKVYDQISAGNPAAYIDQNMLNSKTGDPNYLFFNQNVKQTYIAGDILEDLRKWKLMFDTDIGIPSVHTDKKERLTTDEVNSNNVETRTKCQIWLECIQDGLKQTNSIFGTDISVKLRWEDSYGDDVDSGTVQSGSDSL